LATDIETEDEIATAFKALSDGTRLRIFEFLCSCCCPVAVDDTGDVRPVEGPTVGEVCCRVTGMEKITSTLSFHLKELRHAGLITMERRGKNVICGVNRKALASLAEYFSRLEEQTSSACE
jgi:DNA-binding transcriptional ArsR family regulator